MTLRLNIVTCTHAWGPPQHFLHCTGGTLAHIRICGDCYEVEYAGSCDCTPEQRRQALGRQRVLGDPPQGWGAA